MRKEVAVGNSPDRPFPSPPKVQLGKMASKNDEIAKFDPKIPNFRPKSSILANIRTKNPSETKFH